MQSLATIRLKIRQNQRDVFLFCLWLLCLNAGFYLIFSYEVTPGLPFHPPLKWPTESSIRFDHKKPALIIFFHPKCTCSRATLDELEIIQTKIRDATNYVAVFYQPKNKPSLWSEDENLQRAKMMGFQIVIDWDGIETKRFSATASGSVVLYDTSDNLIFHGGITGARGHDGDNDGELSVIALLQKKPGAKANTRVYGCPIIKENANCPLTGKDCPHE